MNVAVLSISRGMRGVSLSLGGADVGDVFADPPLDFFAVLRVLFDPSAARFFGMTIGKWDITCGIKYKMKSIEFYNCNPPIDFSICHCYQYLYCVPGNITLLR